MVDQLDNLLGAAVHHARDGVCITTPSINPPGPIILYVNPAVTQITGYAAEELVGKTPKILQGPKTDRSVLDEVRRCLSRGEPFFGETINYRKDGSEFRMQWRISPICDDGQKIVNWVAIQRDVTKRRELERQLQESEQKWKSVIDTAPDYILILGQDGNIQFINRVHPDLTMDQVLGTSAYAFIVEDYHEEFRNCIDFVFRSKEFTQCDFQAYGSDLAKEWYSCRFGPYVLDGEIKGVVCISTDITARRLAEERARQQEAELAHVLRISTMGEMASVLAHEINQPLTAITNYARGSVRTLQQSPEPSEDILGAMQCVGDQAMTAGAIVRRLKQYISKSAPTRTRADVNGLLHEIVALVEPQAKANETQVSLELQESLPLVSLDKVQIQQVLVNLLQNAFEALNGASSDHRQVVLATQSIEDQVQVIVKDRGSGMAEVELEEAFQPYFSTKEGGLGMGLSISRTIMESHGGRLWGARNGEQGMTFTLSLPINAGD